MQLRVSACMARLMPRRACLSTQPTEALTAACHRHSPTLDCATPRCAAAGRAGTRRTAAGAAPERRSIGATSRSWIFAAPGHERHAVEPPSLLDVRDAVEACSVPSSKDERRECYLNFGLDASQVGWLSSRAERVALVHVAAARGNATAW
uniref:Uncharacterized protein n=1 Tax=Chlamydomonas euryale TaxID=1486919 RepID=A0A7R9VVZ9_9CHLO